MTSSQSFILSRQSIRDKMSDLQMPVATAADCEKLARLEGLSLENPSVINGILYYLGSLAVTARFEGVTVDSVAEHWFDGWRNDSTECRRWYRPEMIYAARLAWKAFSYPVDMEDGPSIPVVGNALAESPWAQAVARFHHG